MKIASITLEGRTDRKTGLPAVFATIKRPYQRPHVLSEHIVVTFDWNDGRSQEHRVAADDRDDVRSMAEGLQQTLDGCRGTNSMVHDYFRELERFAD